ncbi:MAG: hypothetical protein QOF70_3925 [Acetobacteraceae bacterium]|nr:hypothetical protein [Acetobacteraceae bacterium]
MEKRGGCHEVRRIHAFCESSIDRCEQIAGIPGSPMRLPRSGQARGGPQLPRQCFVLTREIEGAQEGGFRTPDTIRRICFQSDLALDPVQLGDKPAFSVPSAKSQSSLDCLLRLGQLPITQETLRQTSQERDPEENESRGVELVDGGTKQPGTDAEIAGLDEELAAEPFSISVPYVEGVILRVAMQHLDVSVGKRELSRQKSKSAGSIG